MTVDEEKQIVRRYAAGENVRDLARAVDLSLAGLYAVLQRNNAPKRSATKRERSAKLIEACQNGAIVSLAAQQLTVSESTATRWLREHRKGGAAIAVKRGRPAKTRSRVFAVGGKSPIVDGHPQLSGIPFPYPQPLPRDRFEREIERLRTFESSLDANGTIDTLSPVGIRVCTPFFPNRYEARSGPSISAAEAWLRADTMLKAVRLQLAYGDPTTPDRVLRAITLICRTPTIFRPAIAKFIYQRYCALGDVVWDPCAGYGGRLLGAFAAHVRYIGTDVEAATVAGNRELAKAIEYTDTEIHLSPAEDFTPPTVDLVFTSPPYFDRERYSQNDVQSWRRWATLDDWLHGFLQPIIKRAHVALRVGGHLVLNIADLKKNQCVIPLVAHTIDIATDSGFIHAETLRMPIRSVNRVAPAEPVLVFRKL